MRNPHDTWGQADGVRMPGEPEDQSDVGKKSGASWLKRAGRPKSPLYTILVLAAIMAAVISYTAGDPRRAISITPPWQPGEVSLLDLRNSHGELIAPWELRIDSDGSFIVFTSDQRGVGYHEHSTVSADRDTLVPNRTELTYESDRGRVKYTATYGDDRVTIQSSLPIGDEEAAIDLPDSPYFDNEQLVMVIRALPLKRGYKATLKDVITRAAMNTSITLHVVRKEKLNIPAGTFETWKVDLKGTGRTVWIATSEPYQIVKYEDRKAQTTAELVQYTPGMEPAAPVEPE
ncbi:MAG: DUF3108 domain-containing protein [Firmicutes bacterium]|nr:DUF3108 domain-containing protein [Bacillota bacterium]MDD4336880.1 DUF3108 domain-containing protein [Bacillota bacterium]MDD4792600.1 DUF3108 domain-containing protein [Bacillota bacterium]